MSTINLHKNSENILVEQPTIKLFQKLGWITFNAYNEFESEISPLDRNERDEVVLVSNKRGTASGTTSGAASGAASEKDKTEDQAFISSKNKPKEVHVYAQGNQGGGKP